MGNKFTTIKQRFKQIADSKGISYKKLFEIIDMSDGGFKGTNIKRPINSNAIENILTEFPDIDLHWLITGEEKKSAEKPSLVNEPADTYKVNSFKKLPIEQKLDVLYNEITEIKSRLVVLPAKNKKYEEFLKALDAEKEEDSIGVHKVKEA